MMLSLYYILDRLKARAEVVEKIVSSVEKRHPRAYVELHEVTDNRYWVGYLRCFEDIMEDIKRLSEHE